MMISENVGRAMAWGCQHSSTSLQRTEPGKKKKGWKRQATFELEHGTNEVTMA